MRPEAVAAAAPDVGLRVSLACLQKHVPRPLRKTSSWLQSPLARADVGAPLVAAAAAKAVVREAVERVAGQPLAAAVATPRCLRPRRCACASCARSKRRSLQRRQTRCSRWPIACPAGAMRTRTTRTPCPPRVARRAGRRTSLRPRAPRQPQPPPPRVQLEANPLQMPRLGRRLLLSWSRPSSVLPWPPPPPHSTTRAGPRPRPRARSRPPPRPSPMLRQWLEVVKTMTCNA
mmetsp:Transcript_8367/g.23018  ORF Transcript_8367/g.23018 Transcript_8367/m.23018 type:complete len:232 (-) Transcript_8367:1803-2498(-)